MKCSELISELSSQMSRNGDIDVVAGNEYGHYDIEDVVRYGSGPIVVELCDD
jgi:hypothetical protein